MKRNLFFQTLIIILILVSSCNKEEKKVGIENSKQAHKVEKKQKELSLTEAEKIIEIIQNNDVKSLQLLVDGGLDVDSRFDGFFRGGRSIGQEDVSNKGWTMLMVCSFYNEVVIAKYLLEKNANINAVNKAGHTALFLACANRSEEMANFLLDKSADVRIDCKDYNGQSTLQWAIAYDWIGVSNRLLNLNAPIDGVCRETGRNVLLDALFSDVIPQDLVNKIIEKGADVYFKDLKDDETALMWACHRNFISSAKKILEKGVNINQTSKNGSTALSYASGNESCSLSLLEFLVSKGAKITIDNKYGRSALIEAVSSNCLEKVKFLVQKGALINEKSDGFGGVSPLTEAVWNCNYDITTFLIENGANVNIEKDRGETVLLEAVWNEKNLKIVDLLIKKGADVNKLNDDRQSPLLKAVQYNLYDIAVLLYEDGASLDVVDVYGKTIQKELAETVMRTGNRKWLQLNW